MCSDIISNFNRMLKKSFKGFQIYINAPSKYHINTYFALTQTLKGLYDGSTIIHKCEIVCILPQRSVKASKKSVCKR